MHCRILAITQKSLAWLETGIQEYNKRIAPHYHLQILEIPLEKRNSKTDTARILAKEGDRLLSFIKPHHVVVALDVKGNMWSTEQLAEQLKQWQTHGAHVDFLIGGPDGLAPACLQRANAIWSLSRLTFPHHLVRLLLMEQLYRADTILSGHPYHRQ